MKTTEIELRTKRIVRELELSYRPSILVKDQGGFDEIVRRLKDMGTERVVELKITKDSALTNLDPEIAEQLGLKTSPENVSDVVNDHLENAKNTTLAIILEDADILTPHVDTILANLRYLNNRGGARSIIFSAKQTHPQYSPNFNHMQFIAPANR